MDIATLGHDGCLVLHVANDTIDDTTGEYLRAGEAAALLNVSPKTVSRWADQGRIAHIVTLGGHRRFPRSEIDRIARVMTGDVPEPPPPAP